MAIAITRVEGAELYHKLPGQPKEQDCFVQLDCVRRKLCAQYNPEIGNHVPAGVMHGHLQRWSIPALKSRAANRLLYMLRPLAERVCNGYESVWDGNNNVARYSADARQTLMEMTRCCERVSWDPDHWAKEVRR